MKAAGLPELTSFKDIQYLKVFNGGSAAANIDDEEGHVENIHNRFLFVKGLISFGQIRGWSTEEFQSEVQRSSTGKLEDKGQLDDAFLSQRQ